VRRLLLLVLLLLSTACAAAEVQVAVASNMTVPMRRIAASFERSTGHHAVLAFGSTGKLYAQIRNGAPFDVLVAADAETPARLEQEGLGVRGSRFTYAVGRLALWSAAEGIDARGELLQRPEGTRLAIADPKLAPYGAAAMQLLQKLGLAARWQPYLVQGENISQAFQFAASGNARLGFVAMSQVMEDGKVARGSVWAVPANLYDPLRQDAVLLESGARNDAARALLAWLRSDEARGVLRSYGYELP
jgi:molybdate transport system substrate-binding protein